MIHGIGIDIVQLKRVKSKHSRLAQPVLTPKEYETYLQLDELKKAEFFAGRFAIKEAYYKASRDTSLGYQDVEVCLDNFGRPYVELSGVHLSLTHDGDYVVACVVIEK